MGLGQSSTIVNIELFALGYPGRKCPSSSIWRRMMGPRQRSRRINTPLDLLDRCSSTEGDDVQQLVKFSSPSNGLPAKNVGKAQWFRSCCYSSLQRRSTPIHLTRRRLDLYPRLVQKIRQRQRRRAALHIRCARGTDDVGDLGRWHQSHMRLRHLCYLDDPRAREECH